jgi:hypothetical protein
VYLYQAEIYSKNFTGSRSRINRTYNVWGTDDQSFKGALVLAELVVSGDEEGA